MKKLILMSAMTALSTGAFAADCQSPVNLKNFLSDSKAFMDAPIVKLNKNCVPKTLAASSALTTVPLSAFSKENIEAMEYVAIKDQFRSKICDGENCVSELTPGQDTEGRAGITSVDRPENLVDGYLIKTLETMEKRNLMDGEIKIEPWSDWYWPIAVGQLGYRYASPKLESLLEYDEPEEDDYWPFLNKFITENPVSEQEINELSPSEKYDLLMGDSTGSLTKAMWATGEQYYNQYGKVEFWMGLCHGWAPAAYMLPRPVRSIEMTAADGETKIKFLPSDLKALGTLLWSTGQSSSKFIGGRCNDKDPEKDENGRIQSQECFDNNPGTWHLAVVNQVGKNKKTFVMDATYDYEVWNHPVTSYSYTYFNPITMDEVDTLEEAKVKIEDFKDDKFKEYRSYKAKYVVGIMMEVEYLVETMPSTDSTDSPEYDDVNYAYYTYDLELNSRGGIVGGEWYTNKHPDFLWTPNEGSHAVSILDPYIPEDMTLEEIISHPQVQGYVPQVSAQGQPIGKVVEGLLKKASKRVRATERSNSGRVPYRRF
jgi:hypothetical protein